jgi:class 3 adenylate cyclase
MDYDAALTQALALLQQEKRLSYRVLKLRLQLDDDTLEALTEDLIYAKQLAVDEAGKVLVWAGGAGAGEAPSALVRGPALPPRSYTPLYLAEKILTSKTALEDERKQVTVLFADLKGSTELIRDLDPEQARAILDPALHAMMEAVHRYEGTVNQVLGDGIMALFGAPIAHEDHAARGCYAALAMQDALRRYAEGVRRTHGLTVQMRVGLNAGEVVVRAIGNDLHMDYSAVGLTTVLAARMEQLATPGSILLTAPPCGWWRAWSRLTPWDPCRSRGWTSPWRSSSWSGLVPSAGACRPRWPEASPTLWAGRQSWRRCTRRWSGLVPGMGRWWRSSARPAWASRAWCTKWFTHTAPRAGWCSRARRCPTAKPRPTSRCSTY